MFYFRIEHRLADGSCNPYLSQAAILAAGLDGIERKLGKVLIQWRSVGCAARTIIVVL